MPRDTRALPINLDKAVSTMPPGIERLKMLSVIPFWDAQAIADTPLRPRKQLHPVPEREPLVAACLKPAKCAPVGQMAAPPGRKWGAERGDARGARPGAATVRHPLAGG